MLYFSYGSNLKWEQMQLRCPSARFFCRAKLAHHCLAFTRGSSQRKCGVADVIVKTDGTVWGVVYQIEGTDIDRLDKSEGYKPGRPLEDNSYVRVEQYVLREGEEGDHLLVFLYVANKQQNPPLPNAEYKALIIDGAKYWHLPQEYIDELRKIKVE